MAAPMTADAIVGGIAAAYVGASYVGLSIADKRRTRKQKQADYSEIFNDRRKGKT